MINKNKKCNKQTTTNEKFQDAAENFFEESFTKIEKPVGFLEVENKLLIDYDIKHFDNITHYCQELYQLCKIYFQTRREVTLLYRSEKVDRYYADRVMLSKIVQQNEQLIQQNTQLIKKQENLNIKLEKYKNEFQNPIQELEIMKLEREKKEALKLTRLRLNKNRGSEPERYPITYDIYQKLIEQVPGNRYVDARLRFTFCILVITGLNITELLKLKVYHLDPLVTNGYVHTKHSIERFREHSREMPSSDKIYLSMEGNRLLKEREDDRKHVYHKKDGNSYIFSSQTNHNKTLRRESMTRSINKILKIVSKELDGKYFLTSYSLKTGYIEQLWTESEDIKFVKQALSYQKCDVTST